MSVVETLELKPVRGAINWIGLGTMVRREAKRMMRVPIQVFVAPWISALLFIFIFGFVVGSRISLIAGHRYLEFVMPGILMMNIVNSSFMQSSSQVYFSRFQRYVEEILVAPLSYVEMIIGSLAVVVARTTVTAIGILLLGMAFGVTSMHSFPEFIFWVVAVSISFGLLGMIIALWAKNFEQLNILTVFFISPLSMVGGVFNTVNMLPPFLRWMAFLNPFYYFSSGLRHAMIGYSEGGEAIGYVVTITGTALLALWVWRLYSIGYGLRE